LLKKEKDSFKISDVLKTVCEKLPLTLTDWKPNEHALEQALKEIAAWLCENKVAINSADQDGWTALHWAVNIGDVLVVKLLCFAGADVNVQEKEHGNTPLHQVACVSNIEVRGDAAASVRKRYVESYEILYKHRTEVNKKNKDGKTARELNEALYKEVEKRHGV